KRSYGIVSATGDWFAAITPPSLILGRIGCWLHGCCLGIECDASWFTLNDRNGIPRWPAVPSEILFNLCAMFALQQLRRRQILLGQHFHLYLIAYGLFRFLHEFLRDTPRIISGVSGYQFAALAVASFGAWGFQHRRKHPAPILAAAA